MRKLRIRQALAIVALSLIPNIAKGECDFDCDEACSSFPKLDFGIEFLYWKPCLDDLDFAMSATNIENPVFPNGDARYHYLEPRGEPGVRARIGKNNLLWGWNFFLEYTYLASSACDSVIESPSGLVWTTLLHASHSFAGTQVSGEWNFHYQTFDFLFSKELGNCCLGHLLPYFGVRLLDFNDRLKSEATALSLTTLVGHSKYHSDFFGAGLIAGVEYFYDFCDGIGIFAKGSISLIAGQEKSRYSSIQEEVDIELNSVVAEGELKFSADESLLIPGYHIAAGIRFDQTFNGINASFRAGYEFLEWHNAPNQWRFLDDVQNSAIAVSANSSTLGLHGVFAGFDVRF